MEVAILSIKVMVTSSLNLVSFERISLVECVCKSLSLIYSLSSKVIAKVNVFPQTEQPKIDTLEFHSEGIKSLYDPHLYLPWILQASDRSR